MSQVADAAAFRRLHVVGCPRSGTTLLMELLWQSYHFAGRCAHEESLLNAPLPPADRYLSKKPSDTLWVAPLLHADPALWVLSIERDPRAVLCSKHPRRPEAFYCDFARWQAHHDAIAAAAAHPRWLRVRFEDLIANPDAVQNDLEAALPLLGPRRGDFSRYPDGDHVAPEARAALNGVRPFDPAVLTTWYDHLPRIAQQVAAWPALQAALERAGYASDAAWQRCLDGVQPLAAEPPSTPSAWWRLEMAWRYGRKQQRYLRQRGLKT